MGLAGRARGRFHGIFPTNGTLRVTFPGSLVRNVELFAKANYNASWGEGFSRGINRFGIYSWNEVGTLVNRTHR